jgi:hypothetical protein
MLDKDLPGRRDWLDWAGVELMPETKRIAEEEDAKKEADRAASIALQQEATARRAKEIEDRLSDLEKGRQAAIDLHVDGALDEADLGQRIQRIEDEEASLRAERSEFSATPATISTPITVGDVEMAGMDDGSDRARESDDAKEIEEFVKLPTIHLGRPEKRKERDEGEGTAKVSSVIYSPGLTLTPPQCDRCKKYNAICEVEDDDPRCLQCLELKQGCYRDEVSVVNQKLKTKRGGKLEKRSTIETRKTHKKPRRVEEPITAVAGSSKPREYVGAPPPSGSSKGKKAISAKDIARLRDEANARNDRELDVIFDEIETWQGRKRMANRMIESLEDYRDELMREKGFDL